MTNQPLLVTVEKRDFSVFTCRCQTYALHAAVSKLSGMTCTDEACIWNESEKVKGVFTSSWKKNAFVCYCCVCDVLRQLCAELRDALSRVWTCWKLRFIELWPALHWPLWGQLISVDHTLISLLVSLNFPSGTVTHYPHTETRPTLTVYLMEE